MKPAPFSYLRPTTLDDALLLLAEHQDDCAILAGGQSLIPMLNLRLAMPGTVIDIGELGELNGITENNGFLNVGALTRHAETASSTLIEKHAPLLTEAVQFVAHAAIRNRGTIGGSVALADPSAEIPACLVALDAAITLVSSARGKRTVPATEFFTGIFSTLREPDELIVQINIPFCSSPYWFSEVTRRQGDFCSAGAILLADRQASVRLLERVVLFGVSDRPELIRGSNGPVSLSSKDEVDTLLAHIEKTLDPGDDIHLQGQTKKYYAVKLVERGIAALKRQGNKQ